MFYIGIVESSSNFWGTGAALLYGTRYAIRGGYSVPGTVCGAFYVRVANTASDTGWNLGAALSFG